MPPGASAASRVATLTCSGPAECQCFDLGRSRQRSPDLVPDLKVGIVQAPEGQLHVLRERLFLRLLLYRGEWEESHCH